MDTDQNGNANANSKALVPRPLFLAERQKKAGRDALGRFSKGCSGNPKGRPIESLAELCRTIIDKRKLVPLLGEIASGKGRYSRVDPNVRVKCVSILLGYGFGSVADVHFDSQVREQSVTFTKRVIGVDDDAV